MLNYDEGKIEQSIQYEFQDKNLIRQAFSHSSFINEMKRKGMESYERLEFLGDAVLELITSEFLLEEYRNLPEGKLTKLRASIVCELPCPVWQSSFTLGIMYCCQEARSLPAEGTEIPYSAICLKRY